MVTKEFYKPGDMVEAIKKWVNVHKKPIIACDDFENRMFVFTDEGKTHCWKTTLTGLLEQGHTLNPEMREMIKKSQGRKKIAEYLSKKD